MLTLFEDVALKPYSFCCFVSYSPSGSSVLLRLGGIISLCGSRANVRTGVLYLPPKSARLRTTLPTLTTPRPEPQTAVADSCDCGTYNNNSGGDTFNRCLCC